MSGVECLDEDNKTYFICFDICKDGKDIATYIKYISNDELI